MPHLRNGSKGGFDCGSTYFKYIHKNLPVYILDWAFITNVNIHLHYTRTSSKIHTVRTKHEFANLKYYLLLYIHTTCEVSQHVQNNSGTLACLHIFFIFSYQYQHSSFISLATLVIKAQIIRYPNQNMSYYYRLLVGGCSSDSDIGLSKSHRPRIALIII